MQTASLTDEYFSNLISSIKKGLPKRTWDWQAIILTVLLVQTASSRLGMTEWVPDIRVVIMVSFYAVCLGVIIGYSSFTRRNTIWLGVEYGLIIITNQLLKTINPADIWHINLKEFLIRLFDSLIYLIQNQPVYDTLFFLTLSSIGFWIIGLLAGYQLIRHRNFLKITVPSGLTMLIIQMYDPWVSLRAWALAFYIFFALALLGRFYFLNNKNNWKTKRVFNTSDSEWDMSRSAITFAAIAVFAAWALPSAHLGIKFAQQTWNQFIDPIEEKFSNTISALDSPYGAPGGGDFYASNLSLGDNAPISDTIVFYASVDEVKSEPARYYWRGRVYDQYINGQWSNTSVTRQNFNPDINELVAIDSLTREEAIFTITLNFPRQGLIYAPSQTIWVDHKSKITTASVNNSAEEVTAWMADPALFAGNSYQVRSMIANPSIEDLRAAGTTYPKWVSDRYLQYPKEIDRQIRTLAEKVAGSYITPYDKAQAVTSYLRNEITYTSQLMETPPSFEDPIIWMLFEYKKGFCMYSASAEVLMLRSLGIPARMAVGFAEGKFDPQDDRYAVAQLDSHAWPEVYFPNIGWVEFEPTGNQAPLNRPEVISEEDVAGLSQNDSTGRNAGENINETDSPGNANNDPTLLEDQNVSTRTQITPVNRILYSVFFAGFFGICLFFIQRYSLADRLPVYLEGRYHYNGQEPPAWLKRWTRWSMLTSIERSFHSIDLSLRWLHHSQPLYSTAEERAAALEKLIPSAREDISILKQELETTLFTNHAGNASSARGAALTILLKTWKILLRNSLHFLNTRYNQRT